MVVFTCLNCNASLKRVLVEKHYTTVCRRNSPNLTCIDCLKDFNGDNYMSHTTCISEAEKYGDKNVQVKPAGVSQNQWIDVVHLCAKQNKNPRFKTIFEVLNSYSNVPRKKVKFMNFIKNSLPRSVGMASDVFDIIEKEFNNQKNMVSNGAPLIEEIKNDKEKKQSEKKQREKKQNNKCNNNGKCIKVTACPPINKCKKKQSLKDRLRCLSPNQLNDLKAGSFNAFFNIKPDNGEIKLKNVVTDDANEESGENVQGSLPNAEENFEKLTKKQLKKLKNKNNIEKELTDIEAPNVNECAESINKKKHKKRKTANGESEADTCKRQKVEIKDNVQCEDGMNCGNEVELDETKNISSRFNWQEIIKEILQNSPNNELTIKRIQKKVLAVYYTVKGDKTKNEKLISKFNKNLRRTDGVLVENNIAKLSPNARDE